MIFQTYNRELSVGSIRIIGVSSSSMLLVGDAQTIQLASAFDTPAESLIIGPFVPLSRGS
ncbi:spore gernimation protein GerPD [Neobacillus piezotolerans]|uniref:Spore gernimation protein GerPD n=1 Tax=Neobacillus piezotolerans TaxID=2259171 RepID=A0A3D8GM67_9BACI|nr:spore gernimation protein GerPD [Neobacillus piezotolerans]RDU35523.1 spore gernimation protein GerPD [Neobacillus piezotolerans]